MIVGQMQFASLLHNYKPFQSGGYKMADNVLIDFISLNIFHSNFGLKFLAKRSPSLRCFFSKIIYSK